MFKVSEKIDGWGNWAIHDEQGRLRAMVYSTDLTPEATEFTEWQAHGACIVFNKIEYLNKGTDRLLAAVMPAKPNIEDFSSVELGEALKVMYEPDELKEAVEIMKQNAINGGSPFGVDCIAKAELCTCGQPAGKDDELCPSCRVAEVERTHTERENYDREGFTPPKEEK
jgi:hypothetical protein